MRRTMQGHNKSTEVAINRSEEEKNSGRGEQNTSRARQGHEQNIVRAKYRGSIGQSEGVMRLRAIKYTSKTMQEQE